MSSLAALRYEMYEQRKTMNLTWSQLIASRPEGKVFRTWSVSGKSRHIEFTVDVIDHAGITFRKQNGKLQHVSRFAAQNVIDHWELYKEGKVERAELAISNFSTSYLFGLLRGIEIANPS